ncbi:hypothetical protein [Nocardioides pacificus]
MSLADRLSGRLSGRLAESSGRSTVEQLTRQVDRLAEAVHEDTWINRRSEEDVAELEQVVARLVARALAERTA